MHTEIVENELIGLKLYLLSNIYIKQRTRAMRRFPYTTTCILLETAIN